MTAANRTQVVDYCIRSLMDLADRSGGFPDMGSTQEVVHETLKRAGHDAAELTRKTMLCDSLLTEANLVAPAAPEVASVLMQAYQVTTTA
ncbi:hypothetical protein [Paraburkholderia dilworthii]|uniref:hypothetical protein n=1 Tax=Paraburkholderia dilworthii TaxID=948106 RepID=UPI000489E666|nr:hypothetical protein [Paraburkholderia dilworthii]